MNEHPGIFVLGLSQESLLRIGGTRAYVTRRDTDSVHVAFPILAFSLAFSDCTVIITRRKIKEKKRTNLARK